MQVESAFRTTKAIAPVFSGDYTIRAGLFDVHPFRLYRAHRRVTRVDPRLYRRWTLCQRKRRTCQRRSGNREEQNGVVVTGNPIGMDRLTLLTAMQNHPFAVRTERNRDRLHLTTTSRAAVAGNPVVEVKTPEAVRTVIALFRARSTEGKAAPAMRAADLVLHLRERYCQTACEGGIYRHMRRTTEFISAGS